MALLHGLDVVVLDALRYRKHPTHMSVDEAVEVAKEIGAHTTYFTHFNHRVEHNELDAYLPQNMHPAYDGLAIQVSSVNEEVPHV
jgi:phosphoribosyl 1,2-cyclic phosphate phosphodiesterase